jgi:hypothetical protein
MLQMWARACRWKNAVLIADAISWSIVLGGGTLLCLLTLRRHSAMLDPIVGGDPGLAGAF